ncbi:AAA family ATPase [uncultured Adlercreutzia sp.]|uniref:AAA family ATPase n=1 Tax=uncultured Adlercreutzia sp. TaxID=875803 RepID=UPI0026F40603|nr:AAA family ATPase [uncultured Adlercreutzia sp.]
MNRPFYLVFAGVNGVGKSTFYHSKFWHEPGIPKKLPRVNSDELVAQSHGNYLSAGDQLRAGRQALRMIEAHFANRESFNQETTLSGKLAVRNIRKAHDLGYRVVLYYIGVDSPETSLARIAHRVETGGHPIEEDAVRRRYEASLRNFSNVLDLCDKAVVIDNTVEFVTVAQWTRGVLSWVGNPAKHAPWLFKAIRDDTIWRARP